MPYSFDERIGYEPPKFIASHVDLEYTINSLSNVDLVNVSKFQANTEEAGIPLVLDLDTEYAELKSIEIKAPGASEFTSIDFIYDAEKKELTIESPPADFDLRIVTKLNPEANKSGEGLYVGDPENGILSTQGESQGFRKQTASLDRPDVRSVFNVVIIADKREFPTLIANGNLASKTEDPENESRHIAIYNDPIEKPTYLMALVAGDLVELSKAYTDGTGHSIKVSSYATEDRIAETQFALQVCCNSMKYYEETFGIRYKHDELRLAGVSQFNAGAMENTGLIVFNDSCMYTDPHKSSDSQYDWVRHVVAHEYAHYWHGNMVGIKAWPYLFLKEGGATYMEEHYSDATGLTPAIESRIDSVRGLIGGQFAEDASPLAHSLVFADSKYPDNYYTSTTYHKGKELLTTIENYIGEANFREGMKLYFTENDGKAVGLEVFLDCMTRASGVELREQFANWYVQAGTPEVEIESSFDPETKKLTVSATQSCPITAKESREEGFEKQPFLIPMRIAMFNRDNGEQISFTQPDGGSKTEELLELKEASQTWEFTVDADVAPIISYNRNFTSPIRLKDDLTEDEKAFLAGHDSDLLNRWMCTNEMKKMALMSFYKAVSTEAHSINPKLIEAINLTLDDDGISSGAKARTLSNLTLGEFLQEIKHQEGSVDFDKAVEAYKAFRTQLSQGIGESCLSIITSLSMSDIDVLVSRSGEIEPGITSKRELFGVALGILAHSPHDSWQHQVVDMANEMLFASNMSLVNSGLSLASTLNWRVDGFNDEFQEVMDIYKARHASKDHLLHHTWLSYMVSDSAPNAIERIRDLILRSDEVDLTKQNHIYAAVRAFSRNHTVFNAADGSGYSLFVEILKAVNRENDSMAAQLARCLSNWQILDVNRQKALLHSNIILLLDADIHAKVKEVVEMTINSAPQILVFEQMAKIDQEKALEFIQKQIDALESAEQTDKFLKDFDDIDALDIPKECKDNALALLAKVREKSVRQDFSEEKVVESIQAAMGVIAAVKSSLTTDSDLTAVDDNERVVLEDEKLEGADKQSNKSTKVKIA